MDKKSKIKNILYDVLRDAELSLRYELEPISKYYNYDDVAKQILAAIEPKWISVKHSLPADEVKRILVWDAIENRAYNAEFNQWSDMLPHEYITHWMILPDSPYS